MLAKLRTIPASAWIKTVVVLTGIALVPVIYAGALTWANADPMDRLDRIPAAIVNLDEPAEQSSSTGSDSEPTTLTLGDDLTTELLDSEESQNFDWSVMGADEASEALAEAEVYAVLTIPEDFSAAAASLGADDPKDALASQLDITTNDGTNLIAGNMASSVGRVVADTVRSQISEEYLDTIYVGFTTIHDQVSDAADGAAELSNGTSTAHDGSADLVVGLNELGSGASTLASGAADLAAGAHEAQDGANRLATGSSALDDGAQQLRGGASELSGGLSTLAEGVSDADAGAKTLRDGASEANDAAEQLSSGLGQINDEVSGLPDTLDGFVEEAQKFADSGNQLVEGHRQIRDDLDTVTSAGTAADERAAAATSAAQQVQEQTSTLSTTADELAVGLQNWDALTEPERAELISGADQVASGLRDVDAGVGEVLGTESSGTGLAGVRTSTGQLVESVGTVSTGVDQVQAGAREITENTQNLDELVSPIRERLTSLTDGLSAADSGSTELAAGTNRLLTGASDLSAGLGELRTGADAADDASSQLAAGTGELAENTTTLASGAGELAHGTSTLANGADQLAAGSASLAENLGVAEGGATDLRSGLNELNSGADELHTGLDDGASEIPSYRSDDSAHLSTVAADPVSASMNRANEVPSFGHGMAAYFVPLALWIGGLSFYLMFPALRTRAIQSRLPSWLVGPVSLIPGLMMGLVQAILVWSMLRIGLDIEAVNPWGLLGVMLLGSLVFVSINQALVAILGSPGRFLGLILLVLQLAAAGATYPVQTAAPFFQAVHSWLPMTHLVDAVRSLIAGGGYGVGSAVGWLLLWWAVALALTILAGVLRCHGLRETADEVETAPALGVSLLEEHLDDSAEDPAGPKSSEHLRS